MKDVFLLILFAAMMNFVLSCSSSPLGNNENEEPSGNDDEIHFVPVDTMPEPIGGIQRIIDQIVYPRQALANGIEGRVMVKCTVTINGDTGQAEIVSGLGYGLDEEAQRVLYLTKWVPAQLAEKPVQCRLIIPITFELD